MFKVRSWLLILNCSCVILMFFMKLLVVVLLLKKKGVRINYIGIGS